MNKKVSLVLGSGGARGYAHIGVIEELVASGYEISSITGSSMGALIGGIYACGNLEKYKSWAESLGFINVLSLVDLTFNSGGVIKGDKVFEKLEQFFTVEKIEDLDIKFTAVATDLTNKKEIWFQEGDLKTAIRSSISIPSIFTPVYYENKILVDGGVLNPLPIAPSMADSSDITIAVNLNAKFASNNRKIVSKNQKIEDKTEVNIFKNLLNKLGLTNGDKIKNKDPSQIEILNRVIETMQESLSLYKIAGYMPDILIEIPVNSSKTYDFHKAETMIEIGKKATKKALNNYKNKIEWN